MTVFVCYPKGIISILFHRMLWVIIYDKGLIEKCLLTFNRSNTMSFQQFVNIAKIPIEAFNISEIRHNHVYTAYIQEVSCQSFLYKISLHAIADNVEFTRSR